MNVLLAKTAGFCMGVRNALDVALDAAREGPVHTLGPLIHNPPALAWLAQRGILPVEPEAAANGVLPRGATVVVRAHGLPRGLLARIENAGVRVCDATCVHVRKNQCAIREAVRAGRHVYLAADPGHAETVGLQGQAEPDEVTLIPDLPAAGETPPQASALLLAQTTLNRELFRRIAEALSRRVGDLAVMEDSICRATDLRQAETLELARRADGVVVVGGRGSANTTRLADIARESGKPVALVETAEELRPGDWAGKTSIAVVAGASTPDWVTLSVVARLEEIAER